MMEFDNTDPYQSQDNVFLEDMMSKEVYFDSSEEDEYLNDHLDMLKQEYLTT